MPYFCKCDSLYINIFIALQWITFGICGNICSYIATCYTETLTCDHDPMDFAAVEIKDGSYFNNTYTSWKQTEPFYMSKYTI